MAPSVALTQTYFEASGLQVVDHQLLKVTHIQQCFVRLEENRRLVSSLFSRWNGEENKKIKKWLQFEVSNHFKVRLHSDC